MGAVTCRRLRKDKEWCETLLVDFNCSLPVNELLDDSVPGRFTATSFNIHGLEGVGDCARDWDLRHICLRCETGVHWTGNEVHDLKEADVIADDC